MNNPSPPPSNNDGWKNSGFQRIVKASQYSLQGLKACFISEAAFRQEIILCVVLVPIAFVIPASSLERLAMIACLFLILIVELINSAIEALADRIGTEHHPLSGKAKDIGSAAVLLTLCLTALVWVWVLVT